MDLITFITASLISTTTLLVVKVIEELAGHYSHKFSMYKTNDNIFYGILGDIAILFLLIMIFDFLAVVIIPIFVNGIIYIWVYSILVFLICFFGLYMDLKGCKDGRWQIGDYPIPMVYFNWQVLFWANGTVFFLLIGEDWLLFNVIMAITFILIVFLSVVFRRKGIESKLRRKLSCPVREW